MQVDVLNNLHAQAAEAAHRKALLSSGQRKIDSHIRRYAWPEATARARVSGTLATPEALPWRDEGRLHVIVKVVDTASSTPAVLEAAGLEIEIVNDRFGLVQGWIADGAVPALADLAIVQSVSPAWPAEHSTGSVTSQGDHASRADLVRQLGYDGTGVVVGVISNGIDSVAASQASGDLGLVTVPLDPRCRTRSGDEGTAMLEIVHDLAPGAGLLFSSNGSTGLELMEAIECLTSAGADVIVDDAFDPTAPFFEDGPVALTAAAAVAGGVSYHTSAGNFGDHQYLFENYRSGPDGFHDFDPNGGGETLNLTSVPPGGQFRCYLQWADPFGGSSNDYDLYVIDPLTGTILARSESVQDGSQDPKEAVQFTNPFASPFEVGIAIRLYAGEARPMKLLCPAGPSIRLEHASVRFGISGHAARPEVIAVAAIYVLDRGLGDIENFSSNGPAPIYFPYPVTRPKPDLAGFDGVVTTLPPGDLNPFFGTSAAAPHSAAVAALLLSKNPNLTPAQVRSILTSTAVDIGPPGFDDAAGFGRVDALAAFNALSVASTTTSTTTMSSLPTATTSTSLPPCDPGDCDGNVCTVGDTCVAGQCHPGSPLKAGQLSGLVSGRIQAAETACGGDRRKVVRKVLQPLAHAEQLLGQADNAPNLKKFAKKLRQGRRASGQAQQQLEKTQGKLSSNCVASLAAATASTTAELSCLP
jgi:subtilisin family serine protease